MRCPGRITRLMVVLAAALLPLAAQVVVVNPSVSDHDLDAQHLAAIFHGSITTWSDGQSVVLVLADDPTADLHLSHAIGRGRQMLMRAWKRLVFSGMGSMPLSATSSEEALGLVAKTPGAMVLLDQAPADPRWRVIPLMVSAPR